MELRPLFEDQLVNYCDFYPAFTDSYSRMIRGNVVRSLSSMIQSKRFEKLSFLSPLGQSLIDIRITEEAEMILSFNFGSNDTATISTPVNTKYAIESGLPDDPYLVHPKNVLKPVKTEVRKFIVKDKLHFKIGPGGILDVRKDDIKIKVKSFFTFSAYLK